MYHPVFVSVCGVFDSENANWNRQTDGADCICVAETIGTVPREIPLNICILLMLAHEIEHKQLVEHKFIEILLFIYV